MLTGIGYEVHCIDTQLCILMCVCNVGLIGHQQPVSGLTC